VTNYLVKHEHRMPYHTLRHEDLDIGTEALATHEVNHVCSRSAFASSRHAASVDRGSLRAGPTVLATDSNTCRVSSGESLSSPMTSAVRLMTPGARKAGGFRVEWREASRSLRVLG